MKSNKKIKITLPMRRLLDSVGSNNHDEIFAKLMSDFKLSEKQADGVVKQFTKVPIGKC